MELIKNKMLREKYERENSYNYDEMNIGIKNSIHKLLNEIYDSKNDIECMMDDFLHTNTWKNIYGIIPKTYNECVFNKCIILNDYPLFDNLGDIICVFMVEYFHPYCYEHILYYIDCEYNLKQMHVETLFTYLYYYDETTNNNSLLEL